MTRKTKNRTFTIRLEVYEGIVEMAKKLNRSISNTIDNEMEKVVKKFNENENKEKR